MFLVVSLNDIVWYKMKYKKFYFKLRDNLMKITIFQFTYLILEVVVLAVFELVAVLNKY